MEDDDYILKMPVHDGAKGFLEKLFPTHRIIVITARSPDTKSATEEWLRRSHLPFDELVNLKESKKSMQKTDVLVDDYVGNVKEYLENSAGIAILVRQPWNTDHSTLQKWEETSRLLYAADLSTALSQIETLVPNGLPSTPVAADGHGLGSDPEESPVQETVPLPD